MKNKHKVLFIIAIICCLTPNLTYAIDKINNLSMVDRVFLNFREHILYHNVKGHWHNLVRSKTIKKKSFFKLKMAIYTIKENDSLKNIASRAYLDMDTIISINSITSKHDLFIGKRILIPNMKGTIHYINQERHLNYIAYQYQIPGFILAYVNNLKRNVLYKGERIFIPFKRLSKDEKSFFSSQAFSKPLLRKRTHRRKKSSGFLQPVNGRVSSRFGMRKDPFTNRWVFHGGLDIAASRGTPVYAAQSGRIIFSGRMGGYGKLIIVEHKYDYKSFYGHLSKIFVRRGQRIRKGQIIGKVGSTGRSTGPHLHYEIRRFNTKKNPLRFQHNNRKKNRYFISKIN